MSKSAKIMARFIVITSPLSPCANATLGGSFPGPNLRGESEIEKVTVVVAFGRSAITKSRACRDRCDECREVYRYGCRALTFREWCDDYAFASAHFSLLDAMRGEATPIGYHRSRAPFRCEARPEGDISPQSPHIAS